jgi:hypothetical protein
MMCWPIPMACLKLFELHWQSKPRALHPCHPPTLTLPHQGEGDYSNSSPRPEEC